MNTYEVFLKRSGKEEFRHAGSCQAPDDELALMYAQESYARRGEGDEMWVINREHLLVAPAEGLAVNGEKSHRHNDGSAVAARRKADRAAQGEQA